MKSRKGFTLIELLVVVAIVSILVLIIAGAIFGVCMLVKGVGVVDTALDNRAAAYEQRIETNPPLYDVGDIVYHKATDAKMVVAKNSSSWNDVKEGWNMTVKDGGGWDKVGSEKVGVGFGFYFDGLHG